MSHSISSPETDKNLQVQEIAALELPRTPWQRSSYLFVLLTFLCFGHGWGLALPFTIFMVLKNGRKDAWYKHLWAWLLLLPIIGSAFMASITRTIASQNP